MSKQAILHCQFKKDTAGKLVSVEKTKLNYAQFVKNLSIGQTVEVFMEANQEDGTLLQIAKAKVCIRALAAESGNTFEEMQVQIKKKSGLCFVTEFEGEKVLFCKSFADCSLAELSLAIQAIIEVGDFLGVNCR